MTAATVERNGPAIVTTPSPLASIPSDRLEAVRPQRVQWLLLDPLSQATPQGASGQQLLKAFEDIEMQFAELRRWVSILRGSAPEMDFPSMPPKRSFHVRVKVGEIRRGRPAPYALDDSSE